MSKTLSQLEEENAYRLGDVYKCIYSIDNDSDNPIYKEGGIYPVIIGRNGNLGIKDDLGEISMCRTGSSKFKLVEPKVATTFPKVTKKEEFNIEIREGIGCKITREEAEQLRDQLNEVLK
jgi:hypothetical protein